MTDAPDAEKHAVLAARMALYRASRVPARQRLHLLLAVPVVAGSSACALGETLTNFVGLDPMTALFWSAVMGRFVLPRLLWALGWLCTGTMAVAVGLMFATW
jgi:hypothetical protein